jgi:hypothetical protein
MKWFFTKKIFDQKMDKKICTIKIGPKGQQKPSPEKRNKNRTLQLFILYNLMVEKTENWSVSSF